MAALERFLHTQDDGLPVLVRAALAHVQFETIHPFLDGNGRVGRLLITLLLCHARVLGEPLLYLSLYFKQNRTAYYALLDSVRRDGDWEAWLAFFLDGVRVTGEGAVSTAERLAAMFGSDRARIEPTGWRIWWGANLGLPSERLVYGPLAQAIAEIEAARTSAKAEAGWVMDVYLLRS